MQLDPEFADGGHWVCRACRSINPPRKRRCYSCGGDVPLVAAVDRAARDLVPVMAPDAAPAAARSGPDAASAAGGSQASGLSQLVSRADPPITKSRRGSGRRETTPADVLVDPGPPDAPDAHAPLAAAAAPVADAPALGAEPVRDALGIASLPAPELPIPAALLPAPEPAPAPAMPAPELPIPAALLPAPEPAPAPAMPAPELPAPPPESPAPDAPVSTPAPAVLACPYLSLWDDRSTRYDVPHAGNACHALHGAPARTGWRGILARRTGVGPQKVAPHHQAMLCLSETYERCPRYRASVTPVVAPRTTLWGDRPDA